MAKPCVIAAWGRQTVWEHRNQFAIGKDRGKPFWVGGYSYCGHIDVSLRPVHCETDGVLRAWRGHQLVQNQNRKSYCSSQGPELRKQLCKRNEKCETNGMMVYFFLLNSATEEKTYWLIRHGRRRVIYTEMNERHWHVRWWRAVPCTTSAPVAVGESRI